MDNSYTRFPGECKWFVSDEAPPDKREDKAKEIPAKVMDSGCKFWKNKSC